MPSRHLRVLAGEGEWGRVLGGKSSQGAAGMSDSRQVAASRGTETPTLRRVSGTRKQCDGLGCRTRERGGLWARHCGTMTEKRQQGEEGSSKQPSEHGSPSL